MERSKQIVKVSIVGIIANVFLAAFKAAVGLISGSIAVVLDAVNNLSDALSSIITIAGAKLAQKAPDKKHPYGHGRIENISAVTVAAIVLLAGGTAFKESVEKIIHPAAAEYTVVSLIILAAAVPVKFFLGRYVKAQGKKLNSESLTASGTDAFFDSIISLSTLVAAAVSLLWHVNLEGWLGAVIAVIILKAGLEILTESLGSLIGARVEGSLAKEIRETVNSFDGVLGSYDLILNRYGETRTIGSIHIEVADDTTARELHTLSRAISRKIFEDYGIILTVGIYASNELDAESSAIKRFLADEVEKTPEILQFHGFYVDAPAKHISFDIVPEFGSDVQGIYGALLQKMQAAYPDYSFDIVIDTDFSD